MKTIKNLFKKFGRAYLEGVNNVYVYPYARH